MIKLNNSLQIIKHENYPALTRRHLYTNDITCRGFNELTGVGIQDEYGYPCEQEFIEAYVQHIRPDTFRVAVLPFGYTITFQQHPEGIQELVSIDMEELEEQIRQETELKVQNILQEKFAPYLAGNDSQELSVTISVAEEECNVKEQFNQLFGNRFQALKYNSSKYEVDTLRGKIILWAQGL